MSGPFSISLYVCNSATFNLLWHCQKLGLNKWNTEFAVICNTFDYL